MTNIPTTLGANQLLSFLDVGMYESHLSGIYDMALEQELAYYNEYTIKPNLLTPNMEPLALETSLPLDSSEIMPKEITYDDLSFEQTSQDYSRFESEVIKQSQYICDDFCADFYRLTGCKISIKCNSINSPREYNFSTDVLNIDLDVSCISKLQGYITQYYKTNINKIYEIIKERFSSGPGFFSFYSDSILTHLDEIADRNLDYILIGIDIISSLELDLESYQEALIQGVQDNFNSEINFTEE